MLKRSLAIERIYPYSPEHVWQALTDPVRLGKWLMKNDFRPEIGHQFHLETKASVGFNGIVRCEVTEVDAPHRLSYTWSGGMLSKSTLVCWALEPTADSSTRLNLEHSGFEGVAGVLVGSLMASGWRKMLNDRLPLVLAGKEIPKPSVVLMKSE